MEQRERGKEVKDYDVKYCSSKVKKFIILSIGGDIRHSRKITKCFHPRLPVLPKSAYEPSHKEKSMHAGMFL